MYEGKFAFSVRVYGFVFDLNGGVSSYCFVSRVIDLSCGKFRTEMPEFFLMRSQKNNLNGGLRPKININVA